MWLLNHLYNHCLVKPLDCNTANGAMQLDVQFWNTCQDAYFDVMVFQTNAPSNHFRSLSPAYKKHEDEKKEHMASVYLILNIAQHLLHFILSTSGGMGIKETQTFYKRLADLLSLKCDMTYSTLMGWMIQAVFHHPQICTVMCIRGSRSSTHHAIRNSSDTALTC